MQHPGQQKGNQHVAHRSGANAQSTRRMQHPHCLAAHSLNKHCIACMHPPQAAYTHSAATSNVAWRSTRTSAAAARIGRGATHMPANHKRTAAEQRDGEENTKKGTKRPRCKRDSKKKRGKERGVRTTYILEQVTLQNTHE